MKIKTGYVIGMGILFLMGFLIWAFSNKTITDTCSDQMIACVQTESVKKGWDKISGGFGCMVDNVMCVFSRIPEGF